MAHQPATGPTISYFCGLTGAFVVQGGYWTTAPADKAFILLVESRGGDQATLQAAARRFSKRRGGSTGRTGVNRDIITVRLLWAKGDRRLQFIGDCAALSSELLSAVCS